jgi:hypothetical protein
MRCWFISAVGLIAVSVACGGGNAGGKEKLTPLGVSVEVGKDAARLHQYIVETEPTTPDGLVSLRDGTRDRLDALKTLVTTDADRNVMLLIALIRAKELRRLALVITSSHGGAADGQEIKTLYETRLVCDDELRGWAGTIDADLADLEEGECLAEANERADELDR